MAAEPCLHQSGGGSAQNDFAVQLGVIRMRMADEDPFGAKLRLMRVEPEVQFRQENAAVMKLELKRGHKENCGLTGKVST